MKNIDTFETVVSILIIIMMALSFYFACEGYLFFLLVTACILRVSYIWFKYFLDKGKQKKSTPQKFEVMPKKYINTLK